MADERAQTVLVVDDNAENRELARAMLDDEGIRSVVASSGEEAIAVFECERPDCVLMDVRMPGLDGIATTEWLRKLPGGADVAIVFVTAQRDTDTFDRALAAGGDDYVTKPFRPSELLVRVQTALRLRRSAAERSELYAQLKRQRDDLQRLELHKEQLTAFLVHDLKNPVHTIELHAQRILRHAGADQRSRDAAGKIHDETIALMRMITNLLDIGKADEGRLTPARQPIDARDLVARIVEEQAARAASAGVALAPAVGDVRLDADPDLLHRVLANLVDNAIRHAPEGSSIRIEARAADGGAELRVADAGPGVPADQRERVFDRFVSSRSDAARSNRGLGLAFCKLAVEAHHGKIWIEDADPGAVFCIRLEHEL
jgi:signal transduction histidine kinase